jgi:hypothetical protein
MKKIFFLLLIPLIASAQDGGKLTFERLQQEVHKYLSQNDEIYIIQDRNHKVTKESVSISGIHNIGILNNDPTDGVYVFSMNITLAKVYFLLIDGNKFTILDIQTRTNLDNSLNLLLNFCDEHNYCETIITDYVSRLTRVYYNLNKWKGQRTDLNCEENHGIINTNGLP